MTSSNYDDSEKKVTGGRNGFGAKLCNIFSDQFTGELAIFKWIKQKLACPVYEWVLVPCHRNFRQLRKN